MAIPSAGEGAAAERSGVESSPGGSAVAAAEGGVGTVRAASVEDAACAEKAPTRGNALPGLCDAHCHVAFMADAAGFAHDVQIAGARILSATVEPGEYERLRVRLADMPAADVLCQGLGIHPWWVPDRADALDAMLAEFDRLLPRTRYVAEVGLDFSPRRAATRDGQVRAFTHIACACAQTGGKVLSIHAVRAVGTALDILEGEGCLPGVSGRLSDPAEPCTCIFHWFSGSSPELQRAIAAGCYFSVGVHMLASKRGREYAKAIPLNRLLLETDEPYVEDPFAGQPAVPCEYAQIAGQLESAVRLIAELRGASFDEIRAVVAQNSVRLLG